MSNEPTPIEIVTVQRVITLTGPRTWVEHTLAQSYIQPDRPIRFGPYKAMSEVRTYLDSYTIIPPQEEDHDHA